MNRRASAFVRAAAISACAISCSHASAGTTPLDHRLGEFAQQLYHPIGSKRLTVIGDSINVTASQHRMSAGYRDAWHVPWNGWVVHADSGAADIGYLNAQNVVDPGYTFVWDPGDGFGGGQSKINPVRTREINYSKAPYPGMLMSDGMLLSSATSRFPAGDWFTNYHVTARILFYTDTNIMTDVMVRGMRGSTVVTNNLRFRAQAPLGRIQGFDVDLGASGGSPRIQIYDSSLTSNRGKTWDYFRLTLMGVRYLSDQIVDGVQASFIAQGGWRTVDHVVESNFTDAALRSYYGQIGAPTHLILWLGQNQAAAEATELVQGVNTSFKANLRAVIARHNAAVTALGMPLPRWLLVSQYKTGYSQEVHELMAQTMYEVSQSDPMVSFLNLYEMAGAQSFDSATYTSDGIHPNYAGSFYLASLMDGAMRREVQCPADLDGSGYVDLDDLALFLQLFENGDLQADIDASEFVDTDDRDAFMAAFEAGC